MSFQIIIHDVGHGQCVHAFTPKGEPIVIDLGSSDTFSPLEWLKTQTSTIDLLIITHPHGDHIDEILEIDNIGFNLRQLWRPSWLPKQDVYNQNQSNFSEKLDRYFELSESFSDPIPSGEVVGDPAVSGGVSIERFASSACGTSNINNHSGVVVFSYSGSKVIIPGDNEPASWKELEAMQAFKDAVRFADVFMASHHGRESGYYPGLFKLFKPSLCIVSDSRVKDTDARERYSYHATGWTVHSRNGRSSEERDCLTTRSDGYIEINMGCNDDGKNYLSITAD